MSDMLISITLNAEGLKKGVTEAQAKLKEIPDKKTTKLEGENKGIINTINTVKSQLANLALGMVGVTAVFATANKLINNSIKEAKDAVIAQRLLASQLEATGNAAGISAEELTNISKELQKISNMGDDAIIQNLTIPLTTFKNISGDVFRRTQKAIMDLNAVFGDPNNPESLRSTTLQVAKALNDPVNMLTQLRRTGISFSNAQIEVIKNLAETNRLAEAQGLILDELEKQFGGATESTVNSSLQMKNAWNDLLEEMGKKTLPVLDGVNLAFANFFAVMANNLGVYANNQTEVQKNMFRGWNDFSTSFILNASAVGKFIINTGKLISDWSFTLFNSITGTISAISKSIWDLIDKLPRNVMDTLGLGDLSGWSDLADGISDNFKRTTTDVSGYLKTIEADAKNAIEGFSNYSKNFYAITESSQRSYNKQLELQKSLIKFIEDSGGLTPGAQKIEQAQTEYQKLLDIMQKYLNENEMARLSAYGKELIQLANKHKEEIEIIQNALTNKEITKEESNARLLELDNIYMEKTKIIMEKINGDILADLKALEEEELKIKTEKNAKKIMDETQYYNTMKFIDASYYEWKIKQIEKEVEAMDISAEQKKQLLEKLKQDLELEMGEANESVTKTGNKNWFFHDLLGYDPDNPADQQKVTAIQTTYHNLVSGAQNIVGQMLSLNQQRRQGELDKIDEIAAKENWSNEKILAEKKKVNKKYEAEEKKLREVQKGISITQTIINTAEGVTAALKWGYPFGPIFAAIISAMGAVQIALIRAQKFAKGGLFKGKGGPTDDANIISVSDNEYIVNADATRKYLPLLDAINYNRTIGKAKGWWDYLWKPIGQLFAGQTAGIKTRFFAQGGLFRGKGEQRDDANVVAISDGGYFVNSEAARKRLPILNAINYNRTIATLSNKEVISLLSSLNNKLDILNLNLVKKGFNIQIKNTNDINTSIRNIDETRQRMLERGYLPSI